MIDLHSHILHGLDDGPETIEESVDMCRIAFDDGIRIIVATPHFRPGTYEHPQERVQEKLVQLRSALVKARITLEIFPGADVAITPELSDNLNTYPYLTINEKGNYFLAEFADAAVPPNWVAFLYGMIRKGKTPILTHPERNGWFLSKPDALVPFVRAGGLVQITAMSITGEGGDASRYYAEHLLKSGLAHIIATDAHSAKIRRPMLSAAISVATDIAGKEKVRAMVEDTPRAIVEGKRIPLEEPFIPVTKRRSWFQRIARI